MPRYKMPYDKVSAKEMMKKFSDMAYSLSHKEIFQEAVQLLYGKEFRITVDLSKRMQFSCQICNREMNSENAMIEHNRSGGHQKNLEKKNRESGHENYEARATNYSRDSIHHKLLCSVVKPVGLQLVEEYINRRGNEYFKCNLCCSHGKQETMYNHILGSKHTDKYIKTACDLQTSVLTSNEREEIRKKLIEREGINVNALRTIKGDDYYPYKWEAEARTSRLYNEKFKKERRSSSPEPGPSRKRYSSSSSSEERESSRSRKEKSVSRNSRHSRSPDLFRPKSSNVRKKNVWSSGSSRSRSASPVSRPHERTTPKNDENAWRPQARDENLYQFRNRSPPSHSRIKLEPMSPRRDSLPVPVPPPPPPPPRCIQETKDKESQSTVNEDLNELMYTLNFIVKTEVDIPDAAAVCLDDVEAIIEGMKATAEALRQLNINAIAAGGPSITPERRKMLEFQKEKTEKIISYVQKWYRPTYEKLRKTSMNNA